MKEITREFLDQLKREKGIALPDEYVGAHPRVTLFATFPRIPPSRKNLQPIPDPELTPSECALLALKHDEVDALLDGNLDIDSTSTKIAEQLDLDAADVVKTFRAFWFFYNEKHEIRIVNE